jgi:hypothetical protein
MELGPFLQSTLYVIALLIGAGVMVPFMRRAAQVERLRAPSEEASQ